MKKVAVIVLNWNGRELMERFLPSVVANTPERVADIVVADNGSTDGSLALLSEKFPSIRVLPFDRNYGFAEGYNKAIAEVDTPYAVMLNSDVEVTPDWLDFPLFMLDKYPRIAAIQPKILNWKERDKFDYAGAAGGFIDAYGYPFCRGRILNRIEIDREQYDYECSLFWASGACCFLRRETYLEVGGMDARFFAHQEEIDLCWRLHARGHLVYYTPDTVVYHVGAATLSVESPRKTFLNFRNNLLMLYKNLPENKLRHVMRVRCVLDWLAALHFLLKGHRDNAEAVIRARREYRQLRDEYASVRSENLKLTVVDHINRIMPGSLLYLYYVLGVRYYRGFYQYKHYWIRDAGNNLDDEED
jgi:GT2 family glycosyltransferase